MQTQFDNETLGSRSNIITIDRPDSSQLVDLHVYIIPKTVWKDGQNLAENEAMEKAISAGFVHVPQNLTIYDLRQQIVSICGETDRFPKDFIYLRSVGRCLTKVKQQQETDLKVKNYRPPTTFAPEIYILEGGHDQHSLSSAYSNSYLSRESPIHLPVISSPTSNSDRRQIRTLSTVKQPMSSANPSGERQESTFVQDRTGDSFPNFSRASSTLSPRDLAKLREEQERLRVRQLELARQRREIEMQQQRKEAEQEELRRKDLLRQEKLSKEQREKEEEAATRIQASYRGYHARQDIRKQREQELAAAELERLQREARELARRKAEDEQIEERQARDVVKLSNLLEELKNKRIELETVREAVIRQMQQLHTQISSRRKEERDSWKEKYLMEKKKTIALEERARTSAIDRTDIKSQIEQAKLHLKNATKLRQQAENECEILKKELQQINAGRNTLEKHSQPVESPNQEQKSTQDIPITLDITLQY